MKNIINKLKGKCMNLHFQGKESYEY